MGVTQLKRTPPRTRNAGPRPTNGRCYGAIPGSKQQSRVPQLCRHFALRLQTPGRCSHRQVSQTPEARLLRMSARIAVGGGFNCRWAISQRHERKGDYRTPSSSDGPVTKTRPSNSSNPSSPPIKIASSRGVIHPFLDLRLQPAYGTAPCTAPHPPPSLALRL